MQERGRKEHTLTIPDSAPGTGLVTKTVIAAVSGEKSLGTEDTILGAHDKMINRGKL